VRPRDAFACSSFQRSFLLQPVPSPGPHDALASVYREVRRDLCAALRREHPTLAPETLTAFAQGAVDHALFLAFAAARGRIDQARVRAAASSPPMASTPALRVPPDVAPALARIATAPLAPDVPLHALGRIFERALPELEALRMEAVPASLPQRKADGAFYTPEILARLLAERTVGLPLSARRAEALAACPPLEHPDGRARRIEALLAHRRHLHALRVLDPACGTGAFLLAAHDVLTAERDAIDTALAELGAHGAGTEALRFSLFGVDRDPLALGVARLSLALAEGLDEPSALASRLACGDAVLSDEPASPFDALPERFDVVLGNPPFVRGERLRPLKPRLRRLFSAYHGAADLYVYFIERGLGLLAPDGRLGYVVSSSLFRAAYAAALRDLLCARTTVELLVDLGDGRIFPDAPDAYPALLVARAAPPPSPHVALGAVLGRGDDLASVPGKLRPIALTGAPGGGFLLASPALRRIHEAMLARGTPLGRLFPGAVRRGVLSGHSQAFVVDRETRDALVAEHPPSAHLFKPLLRGQDLCPFHQRDPGLFLIFTRHGTDIDAYPSVRAHLERFREGLEPRPKTHPPRAHWPGRKPGRYRWYEIQDAARYFPAFDEPKIVWPDIAKRPRFSWDERGFFLNNLGYFLPSRDLALLGVLASRPLWFALSQISLPLGERGGILRYRLFSRFIERLPLPSLAPDARARIGDIAGELREVFRSRAQRARAAALEEELSARVCAAFGLAASDARAIEEATGYAYGEP
jgi:hypothetical protein